MKQTRIVGLAVACLVFVLLGVGLGLTGPDRSHDAARLALLGLVVAGLAWPVLVFALAHRFGKS